jgi:two-component system cell cycle response regulator DivK
MDYDTFQWPDKCILIAEDDFLSQKYFSRALAPTRAKLLFVENGKEALEACSKNKVDLALMDIKMPLKNGLTTTKELKEKLPELPVIVQTAYAYDYDRINAMDAGADEYITKPILREKMFALMKKYLG